MEDGAELPLDLPFGMATSVGPLPLDDVDDAVAFALAAHPRFPTVPVVSSVERSLLAQAVAGLPRIDVRVPGLLEVDVDDLPDPVDAAAAGASVTGEPFAALHAMTGALAAVDDGAPHPGPVRVGLLGPVTVALALRAAGVAVDKAVALAGPVVEQRSLALLATVRAAVPVGPIVVVLSEPGLIGAMHPTFPLTPWEIRALLDPVVDALDRSPAARELLIGVHVPGHTDWETVIASRVSLISAPADGGLVGWAPQLEDLLERGGWIAWGAVPVDQPLGTGEELLWRRLAAVWGDLGAAGVDPMRVRLRAMVSPADGLGHFGRSQAERVMDLVTSVSSRVRRQTVAARLSLGA